ncbi:MAG: hypothetical protein PHC30_06145 [Lentisphaeria bacterium]|jgi:nitrogen regulatory protein PII|nr:hypothetical protein [Lentisphaeria bacterium]
MSLKMIMIVFNISIQEEVLEAVQGLGVTCYTRWPRVLGKGKTTGPKLDDNIWPGANSAMITVVTEDEAARLMAAIQKLRDEIGTHEGVKAFQIPVEKMTGDV